MTINNIKPGESAIVSCILAPQSLKLRLYEMGIIPNTKITIKKIAPLGDPIQIKLRGYEIIIRLDTAKKIHVIKE